MKYIFPMIFSAIIGCSSLPINRTIQPPITINAKNYNETVGVIHVHTKKSHDSPGNLEEVVSGAETTNTDFIIITDHGSRGYAYAEGNERGPLIIVGEELSVPTAHILGIGHKEVTSDTFDQVVEDLHAQNALAIVAHPCRGKEWKSPSPIIEGIEMHNTGDMVNRAGLWNFFTGICLYPISKREAIARLTSREKDSLSLYDILTRDKHITGIVGTDVHAVIRFAGLVVDNYHDMFAIARNHVFVSEFNETCVIDALRKGHCFIGFDYVADTSGFSFTMNNLNGQALMGDELKYTVWTTASIKLPRRAHVFIYKDGEKFLDLKGKNFVIPLYRPGDYRVEAHKDTFLFSGEEPWIYSNTIHLH